MTRIQSPLDHVTITPTDYEKSLAFYDKMLATLGMKRIIEKEDSCGFGIDRAFFWLGAPDEEYSPSKRVHVAFAASSKNEVNAFYSAALAAGATDHGAPGYRARYHANYYAAFVIDPDGHNIEAVYREGEV